MPLEIEGIDFDTNTNTNKRNNSHKVTKFVGDIKKGSENIILGRGARLKKQTYATPGTPLD